MRNEELEFAIEVAKRYPRGCTFIDPDTKEKLQVALDFEAWRDRDFEESGIFDEVYYGMVPKNMAYVVTSTGKGARLMYNGKWAEFVKHYDPDTSFLNGRQKDILEFVKQKHGNQKRKYTGEPYWHHLVEVAAEVKHLSEDENSTLVPAALCHDLFEDTEVKSSDLIIFLTLLGYLEREIRSIVWLVNELTDQFTKEKYPDDNRGMRKFKESQRLGKTLSATQTIKYADLISNTKSIAIHDPGFAKVYLREKRQLLYVMNEGDKNLYFKAIHTLIEAENKLGING